MKSKSIPLPQVKKIHLEFDVKFIRSCLRKRKSPVSNLNWSEVLYKLYDKCEQEENKLLHVASCCNVAIEQIGDFKKQVEQGILKWSGKKCV